jgi:hypothetical protein
MALGDGPQDEALMEAWSGFCRRLEEAGALAFKQWNPPSPLQRADAFRFLTQNLGQAFDLALETRDTRYPKLHDFCNATRKLGGDNADYLYIQAWIDGKSAYKITGNRGTVRFLNFTVQGPRPEKQPGTDWPSLHDPFGDIPEANFFGHQLETEWDGNYELYIGGEKQGKNWLPTSPGARKLFIRQGFDRLDERPATMRIERLDMEGPRPMPTPDVMMEAMNWAGEFVYGLMRDWPDHTFIYNPAHYHEHLNEFPQTPGSDREQDKKRGRQVTNMQWQIAPDEALIIEFEDPKSFWMTTNMGSFYNSMDFLYRPISHTPSRTKVDGDGRIRLVLAHADPGLQNWVDTQGFTFGALTYRDNEGGGVPEFRTQLVKHAELARHLPADTANCTPEQRLKQMRERFHGILQRYVLA